MKCMDCERDAGNNGCLCSMCDLLTDIADTEQDLRRTYMFKHEMEQIRYQGSFETSEVIDCLVTDTITEINELTMKNETLIERRNSML